MNNQETFRSAEIISPGVISLRRVEKRKPKDYEVLIRIKSSAVCGSDVHIFTGKHPYTKLPSAIGHEISGLVEEIGKEVKTVKVGNRVCVEPLITCNNCYYCKRGRYNYCEKLKLKYRSGYSGYAEYYYAEERWIHHLPNNISFDEGALIEPLAVAVHAVSRAGINLCDSICIVGDGPVALMIMQVAYTAGAGDIFLLGIQDKNLKIAEKFGAISLKNNEKAVQEVLKRTCNRGVNVSFEVVGLTETFDQALSVVCKGGRSVITGIFEEKLCSQQLRDSMVREVNVIGTSSYCWDFEKAILLASYGRIDLKSLITHKFKLEDVEKAMSLKIERKEQPIKIILKP